MTTRRPARSRTSTRRLARSLLAAAAITNGVAGAAALVACRTDPEADVADASAEASVPDATPDAGPPRPDSGARPACTAVTGPCDLVTQDCPASSRGTAQECVVASENGSFTTACAEVQASQQLPIGRACCPDAPSNPCLPGLTCVGRPCGDAGVATGRCTPACCEGDDLACGRSDPEGITGKCDLVLVAGGETELHRICSYRERCAPFGEEPCRPGQMCLVEDGLGTASCLSSFDKALGESCTFSNECRDGLYCLRLQGEPSGRCRMMCLTPGAVHPFDASVDDGGPNRGGCPAGSTCDVGPFTDLPAWLSFCRLDGG